MTSAPSQDALEEMYRNVIDDAGIDLNDPIEDTVEWAIDELKSTYAYAQVNIFQRAMAKSMAEADPTMRVDVLNAYATELVSVAVRLEPSSTQKDARQGIGEAVRSYEARRLWPRPTCSKACASASPPSTPTPT